MDDTNASGLAGEKKKEVIRITARSFFDEMRTYGFNEADVIDFTTEILDLLMAPVEHRRQRHAAPTGFSPQYDLGDDGKVHVISGPRLRLKRLSRSHSPALQAWRKLESYRGTLIETLFDLDNDEIFARYTDDLNEFFVVADRDDSPLGFVTYERHSGDPSNAKMQKFLADVKKRGRGHGTEMTYLWLHYGFDRLGLRKVSAKTVDSNLANINLNRKLGFHFEGHLRQEVRVGGAYVDVMVMSVLRDGFAAAFVVP